jgi:hypothetical protein
MATHAPKTTRNPAQPQLPLGSGSPRSEVRPEVAVSVAVESTADVELEIKPNAVSALNVRSPERCWPWEACRSSSRPAARRASSPSKS